MIIIQVAGGLGNQLQQYALYRKYVSLGVAARLDTSWFDANETQELVKENKVTERTLELLNFDRLTFETCSREEKEELIGADSLTGKLRRKFLPSTVHWFHESEMYHPEILNFENMYLSGYFACEKYYADILYDLRERIQFPPSNNPVNEKLIEEMSTCESVSVHIRRGDYLNQENKEMFGNICTSAYYKTAIKYMEDVCDHPHYYIFSDDVDYAKKAFKGEKYSVIDVNHGQDSFYDIQLMSNCKHNICANSTFSFWGARLNKNDNKITIRPTIHKNSQKFVKAEMEELWTGWSFVSPAGEM